MITRFRPVSRMMSAITGWAMPLLQNTELKISTEAMESAIS